MRKLLIIGLLAVMICVASVSALGVTGAIIQKDQGQGSVTTSTMTVYLSGIETETDIMVDVGNMPAGVSVTVDKPSFHIIRGQRVPVIATIVVAPDAPLGLATGNILIHPVIKEGAPVVIKEGLSLSAAVTPAISVPVKITVCEPQISRVSFTSDKTYGATPLTVKFTGTVVGGGLTQTYYKWEYAKRINDVPQGKIAFSTEKNPQFTFTDIGKYDIYFTAGNVLGSQTLGSFRQVTVIAPPTPTPTQTLSKISTVKSPAKISVK